MKPSDAELNELLLSAHWIDFAEDSHGVELSMRQTKTAMQLAKAELQRRQQPASVPAELDYAAEIAKAREAYSAVLADTVDDAFKEGWLAAKRDAQIVGKAAAYGREQALKEPPTC